MRRCHDHEPGTVRSLSHVDGGLARRSQGEAVVRGNVGVGQPESFLGPGAAQVVLEAHPGEHVSIADPRPLDRRGLGGGALEGELE